MKRRIPLLLFIAAAVAAGLYFYPRFLQEPASEGALTVSGNIEAHESVLSFKVQGRIVELLVEEGQWVKEGTVIARLDAADFRQQVALEDASLRVREAELALALAGTRQQEIEAAQQTLIDAEADLKQKGLDFERARKPSTSAPSSATTKRWKGRARSKSPWRGPTSSRPANACGWRGSTWITRCSKRPRQAWWSCARWSWVKSWPRVRRL